MDKKMILYHGTDARLLSLSDEKRSAYLECCKQVIKYLWSVFKPYYVTKEPIEIIIDGGKAYIKRRKIEMYKEYVNKHSDYYVWSNFIDKLSMCECNENGCGLYQYGDLYFTGDKEKAKRYARSAFAGGEVGLIAYRLIQGAEVLKDKIPYEELDAIKIVKAFATEKEKPIVLRFEDFDTKLLLSEDGKPMSFKDLEIFEYISYRYNQKIDLKQLKIEEI